jgi:pyrroloquinoline quinone biosynthesis protein A
MWTKPAATEMRFGFEVTMYVMNKFISLAIHLAQLIF